MSPRSRANRRSTPARSTLTATGRAPSPVLTSARWTWAIEAAATGSPKLSNSEFDLRAERGLDDADRGLPAHRRHAVLQALEFEGDLGPDDVGPGREELAELDVGRAEPVDRAREAGEPIDIALGDQIGETERQAGDRRQTAPDRRRRTPPRGRKRSRRAPAAGRGRATTGSTSIRASSPNGSRRPPRSGG